MQRVVRATRPVTPELERGENRRSPAHGLRVLFNDFVDA